MPAISNEKYDSLLDATFDVLSSLYSVSIGSMTAAQREAHQTQLGQVYATYLKLEAKTYAQLSEDALRKLPALARSAKGAQDALKGLKRDAEVLNVVAGVLNVFVSIATLVA